MFWKQFIKKATQEQFDVERFEVRVALPNGESVGVGSVGIDEANKTVWLNADTLGPTDEDDDYLPPSKTEAFDS